MATDPTLPQFQTLKAQYFDALCRRLSLDQAPLRIGTGYAIAAASGGNVRVFFEHDRGLCHFSLAPIIDDEPMCDVETIAGRFPRIRTLPEGAQRLTLAEQAALIAQHWPELQEAFALVNLPAMREWISGVRAAVTRKYSGAS
jgi:hypothetical protein